ncbi:flavin-dependent oxidoreductase [Roseiarcaceae bacterium H3SJ34-1]|uniref:flavin-dependent oxidoreductase n=1 Tax=Terripilifer ovatus TaxID=3032367 RepID=UPI003AB94453|nr:flavin-dependent oxidoreductase [Roseiarcaceae bacterium H3SJ34-1]
MSVIIVGGGIGGLSLALALFKVGVPCRIYEAAAEIKPLGVGLNLLPHAVTELGKLGLLDQLLALGVETRDVSFFTAHGQLVHREERGRHAGYTAPQISMHRGDLHMTLLQAVIDRLGEDAVHLGHRCVSADQDASSATAHFLTPGNRAVSAKGSVVIGCDGVHSVIRKQMYPDEAGYRFHGTVQYRGVTVSQPFLTGKSMAYVGTPETGKLVVYPIRENVDTEGRQLINWVVEVAKEDCGVRDWNRRAGYDDFIDLMSDWSFDWLDVPAMIRNASSIYEYPVVDQDPLPAWTDGRITLLGDAAHPMLPRGSNGAAQAIIDGNTLAQMLATDSDPLRTLKAYEEKRLPATARIVLTNREQAPDAILGVVEQRTGGRPFAKLEDVISQEEVAQWQDSYKSIAGFSIAQLQK